MTERDQQCGWVWTTSVLIGCLALCLGGRAAEFEQNSAAWCLQTVLQSYGVTTDYAEVRSQMGAGFAPVLADNEPCFYQAWRAAEAAMLQTACARYGFAARVVSYMPATHRSILARRQVRIVLQRTWQDRHPVLLLLPSDAQGRVETWGLLNGVTDAGAWRVLTPRGLRLFMETPRTSLVLEITNACPTPSEQVQQSMYDAIRLLRGHGRQKEDTPRLVAGVQAVDLLVNMAHRTPWCRACDTASLACVSKVLAAWSSDLQTGVATLQRWRKDMPAAAAPLTAAQTDLTTAAMRLGEAALLVAMTATSTVAQSVCGEELRTLNVLLWQTANDLARACDAAVMPYPTYVPPLPRRRDQQLTLVEWLPLYRAMEDGQDPLLCSTLIALRLAGSTEPPEILRGPYTGFVHLELRADDCARRTYPIEQNPQFAACLRAAGMTPAFLAVRPDDPPCAQDFVRQTIMATLNTGMPVLARGMDQTHEWGVIIGYTNSGRALLCRAPGDTSLTFRVLTTLPPECVLLQPAGRTPSVRETALSVLRAGLAAFTNQDHTTFVTGERAWHAWLAHVQRYAGTRALPTRAFARANGATWTWLRDDRRASYKYFGLLVRRVPEIGRYLTAMQNLQVQLATIMTHAQADGCVLRLENGQNQPIDWFGALAGQQLGVMSNCLAWETRTVETAREALAAYDRLYGPRAQGTKVIDTAERVRRARAAADVVRAKAARETGPGPAASTTAARRDAAATRARQQREAEAEAAEARQRTQ